MLIKHANLDLTTTFAQCRNLFTSFIATTCWNSCWSPSFTSPSPIIMSGAWQHAVCGCFDNFGLCIVSYFVPCYTFGKNSEAVGESCVGCGLAYLIPIVNCVAATKIRGKIREQKAIAGSTFGDLALVCCCPLCALVQEAQEVQVPGAQAMARQ